LSCLTWPRRALVRDRDRGRRPPPASHVSQERIMHTHVRRAVRVALVAGGLVVAGAVTAHAADDDVVDATVGTDTSVDLHLSEVSEETSDAELDTPVDLPEVDTEGVGAVV